MAGYTVVELLLAIAIVATIAGMATPLWSATIEHLNAAGAARYVAGRIALARLEAVRRSSVVGLRFTLQGTDYSLRPYLDGDGNGLRLADVVAGTDTPMGLDERLGDQFRGVQFGLLPGVPDMNGATGNPDGVRIGSTAFLSLSPVGSATGGTLYIRGARSQFAVRVLGATGRTRLFFYDTGMRRWIAR
jgi:type II secretory pathway pseudopilin PulG